jgi:predicted amidohydrolase
LYREPEYEKFKVALCQYPSVLGDQGTDPRRPNLEKAIDGIRKAASSGAKLAIFGEAYLTGYETNEFSARYATMLEPPDEDIQTLIKTAQDQDIYVIMGMTTRPRDILGDLRNTTVLIGPEGFVGSYSKCHLATSCLNEVMSSPIAEKAYWGPGNDIPIFRTKLGNIGIHICYDIYFPEVARVQTLKGAHMLINTSASVHGYEETWNRLVPVRAFENQIWYVIVSGVGKQKDFTLFGGSKVVDPNGNTTAQCKDLEEDFTIAEIDYSKMRQLRQRSHYFNDRKPALYSAISDTSL